MMTSTCLDTCQVSHFYFITFSLKNAGHNNFSFFIKTKTQIRHAGANTSKYLSDMITEKMGKKYQNHKERERKKGKQNWLKSDSP